ncbi:beta-lactamase family protein [Crocinitomicaceae bacterium]|nr:beta-lactamase family protein [Crocinitomicaceae bacterium]
MKHLKKILRVIVLFVVGIVLVVNATIILTGRFYIYRGIKETYLKGRTGPTIYDLETFHTRKVDSGSGKVFEFPKHSKYNTQKIPDDLRQYIEELDTKALLVVKNDTLIYEEYWDEHNQGTLSNSFSVAKTVVAILVGIAIDEGYIGDIDDPVYKYIPQYKNGSRDKITIKHLLQMASGLSWTESGVNPFSDNAESYYGTDLDGLILRQRRESEPGKMFKYQGGNSQLLAMIVEKATGKNISDYASEKVWSKLGMEEDAYWSLDAKNGQEKAFCCLYAQARDFAKIGRMFMDGGKYNGEQIIPRWYFLQMTKQNDLMTEYGLPNYQYGYHIWTYRGNADEVFYCRGILGQYIICIPDRDLMIIRLGMKRKDDFVIPEHLKDDKEYVESVKYQVGHCLGLFQYITLGKILASETAAK